MKILSKNITFLILAVFLLTSCSVESIVVIPSKTTLVTADYPKNKKGVVVIRILSPVITGWQYYSLDDNQQYKKSDIDMMAMAVGPGNYQVLMLDPGVYTLASFQDNYSGYNRPINFKGNALSLNGLPKIGAFEVKSEVVSYVGDLEFKNFLNLNIKDHFEEAKSFFKTNYPKINSPIVKNLAYKF